MTDIPQGAAEAANANKTVQEDGFLPIEAMDNAAALAEQVEAAFQAGHTLKIQGGDSKAFYGHALNTNQVLDMTTHQGVVAYEPSELAITLRAGTPLAQVEALLAQNGQQFPFEPPHFGDTATVGGMVAAGLSGPGRVHAGSLRDAVLGVKIINGRGEILQFGGQVMKNVAGYDVSRLMAGSLGILGALLEVSLRVAPKPASCLTLVHKVALAPALTQMRQWAQQALPITATAWQDGQLFVRLCGNEEALPEAQQVIKGTPKEDAVTFWSDLREQRLGFFAYPEQQALWRLSIAPAAQPPQLPGQQLVEWSGALRWLRTAMPGAEVRAVAKAAGGHATLFRSPLSMAPDQEIFAPLSAPVMQLHRNLKQAFDPANILNPGRMYREL